MLATSEEMKQPIAEPMRRRVIQQAEQVYATIADQAQRRLGKSTNGV